MQSLSHSQQPTCRNQQFIDLPNLQWSQNQIEHFEEDFIILFWELMGAQTLLKKATRNRKPTLQSSGQKLSTKYWR